MIKLTVNDRPPEFSLKAGFSNFTKRKNHGEEMGKGNYFFVFVSHFPLTWVIPFARFAFSFICARTC